MCHDLVSVALHSVAVRETSADQQSVSDCCERFHLSAYIKGSVDFLSCGFLVERWSWGNGKCLHLPCCSCLLNYSRKAVGIERRDEKKESASSAGISAPQIIQDRAVRTVTFGYMG